MAGTQDSPDAIRIVPAASDADWHCADLLMAQLKEWDMSQSEALGFAPEEVLDVFYPDDLDTIRRQSEAPQGCLLLARDGNAAAGCAAFRRLSPRACEAFNVYVRPDYRGRGIGSALLQHLKRTARDAGYQVMCLETATFMRTAHELYRSLEFRVRSPYRAVPSRVADVTIWMQCQL